MNKLEQFFENAVTPEDRIVAARNAAQFELAEKLGIPFDKWMEMKYHDKFRVILESDPDLVGKLVDINLHDEAVEEIAKKHYPPNTIH